MSDTKTVSVISTDKRKKRTVTYQNGHEEIFYRHQNPDGSKGPWIHESCAVASTAHISPQADLLEARCTVIMNNVHIGADTTIASGVVLGEDSKVGEQSTILYGSSIGQRTTIGNNVKICNRCEIGPSVTISDDCTIRNRVHVPDGSEIYRSQLAENTRVPLGCQVYLNETSSMGL